MRFTYLARTPLKSLICTGACVRKWITSSRRSGGHLWFWVSDICKHEKDIAASTAIVHGLLRPSGWPQSQSRYLQLRIGHWKYLINLLNQLTFGQEYRKQCKSMFAIKCISKWYLPMFGLFIFWEKMQLCPDLSEYCTQQFYHTCKVERWTITIRLHVSELGSRNHILMWRPQLTVAAKPHRTQKLK